MSEDKAIIVRQGPADRNGGTASTAQVPVAVAGTGMVSILIPCCGGLEFTRLCVPSLLRHTRPPFELIFLDIGSLDGTAELGPPGGGPCPGGYNDRDGRCRADPEPDPVPGARAAARLVLHASQP
jgi:hypothetical protein